MFHVLFRKIYILLFLCIVFYRCPLGHIGLKCVVPTLFRLWSSAYFSIHVESGILKSQLLPLKYLFFFVSVRFCFTYFSALLLSMFIIAFSCIETFIIIKCPSVSLVTFFLIFSSYISVPVQFYCGSRLPDVIFHSFTFNLFVLSSRGIHLLIYKGGQSKEI